MIAMLKGHHKTFEKRLKEITNANTVINMLEAALSEDVDAPTSRVQMIRDRIVELQPKTFEEVVTTGSDERADGTMKPISPR